MTLHPLFGHEEARKELSGAVSRGALPQVICLVGPQGVGKQRLALWLAQLLLCDEAGPGTGALEPCGRCRGCLQASGLGHPDLHWIVPVLRPKAGEPDKQVEELAELIAEVVAARREQPFYTAPDGMAGHFVATARLIQRKASLTPAMGRRKVFIIAEADRLVPQESSPEAANALLKLFEEPPADTVLVLTTTDLNALLPTIRSRAVPVRLRRLSDEQVEQFLAAAVSPALSPRELSERVRRAAGAIGQAAGETVERDRARETAHRILESVMAGPGPRAERVLKQGPFAARGDFTEALEALAETLADASRQVSGTAPRESLPRVLDRPLPQGALVAATRSVLRAREDAQGNVNPQLILAVLAEDLAEALCA
jgi:DNA polymerase-3 subunit delta'